MLAPIDKIRSRGNDIIQVVITRKCNIHTCTNCTQLLPFRKDAKEMSLDCIEKALISTKGWPGVVAAFGGNPCNHSRFPEVCELWKKHIPNQRQRGLWTNDLMKHGAIAKEVFWPHGRFNINVHGEGEAADEVRKWLPGIPIYGETGRVHHSAMLLNYRDYNISEEEWNQRRERCEINRNWSSGVYEGPDGLPYAYFCEVAGSISGILGENNGIPAVPGWWQSPMEKFQFQVEKCCNRGCGVPLKGIGHQDSDAVYDISPSWVEATNNGVGKVSRQVHETQPGTVHETTDYIGRKLKLPVVK